MLQAGDPLPEGAPQGARDEDGRLAVFDDAVAEIAARVEPAYRQADGWLEQIRAGLLELLRFCDERPETARELVVDSIAWGAEVLKLRIRLLDACAEAIDRGGTEIEAIHASRPGTAENLVGACVSLVHTRLLQAEGGSFVDLGPSLMSMIVHPYLGPEAAKHELKRTFAYAGMQAAARGVGGLVVEARERSY